MKLSSGRAPHFCGTARIGTRYDAGDIVVAGNGMVMVSKRDDNPVSTDPGWAALGPAGWAALGPVGAMPTQVKHKWRPVEAKYPCGDAGEMSDAAEACEDCWKDADYKNAFRPEAHLYVIKELGLP